MRFRCRAIQQGLWRASSPRTPTRRGASRGGLLCRHATQPSAATVVLLSFAGDKSCLDSHSKGVRDRRPALQGEMPRGCVERSFQRPGTWDAAKQMRHWSTARDAHRFGFRGQSRTPTSTCGAPSTSTSVEKAVSATPSSPPTRAGPSSNASPAPSPPSLAATRASPSTSSPAAS